MVFQSYISSIFRLSFALFLVFTMGACQRVQTEVTSFSSLPAVTSGEPFFVLPNEQQASSAEFNQYAASISRRLTNKGWYRVMDSNQAKYVVMLDYGVAGSTTKTGSTPIYGQTGGGSTSHSGSFNTYGGGYGGSYGSYSGTSYTMPTWGVVGAQSYSYTHHQRYFQMKVIDRITDAAVYETKAASEGSSSTFGTVAECIFDTALANFPLQSSSSDTVLMDKCGT